MIGDEYLENLEEEILSSNFHFPKKKEPLWKVALKNLRTAIFIIVGVGGFSALLIYLIGLSGGRF